TPSLLYSNILVTSVLQLFFQLVSDLQKFLSFEPQIVDASAAHFATLIRRIDELAVDIEERLPPFHDRDVYAHLRVKLLRWLSVVLSVVADIANALDLAPVLRTLAVPRTASRVLDDLVAF